MLVHEFGMLFLVLKMLWFMVENLFIVLRAHWLWYEVCYNRGHVAYANEVDGVTHCASSFCWL